MQWLVVPVTRRPQPSPAHTWHLTRAGNTDPSPAMAHTYTSNYWHERQSRRGHEWNFGEEYGLIVAKKVGNIQILIQTTNNYYRQQILIYALYRNRRFGSYDQHKVGC